MENILCLVGVHHWMYSNKVTSGKCTAFANRFCDRCKIAQEATLAYQDTGRFGGWKSVRYLK